MKSRRCRRRYKPILQFISVYTYQPWEYLFISDQYDNQFFSDLSRCIHESDSMKMSMYQLHSLLKSRDAWQVILLWEWNPNKEALHCIEIISDPSEFLEAFKTTSASLSACYLTPAIPFHAFKEKRGVIAYDLKDDPRYEIAQKAGIESGLVIPIFNHSQASCVLEIYKKGALDASNESQLQTLMYWIQLQYEIFFKHLLIEKQLKAQRKVLDSMVDAVYSCDMQGNIQTWSKGCELIYKWTEAEIIGKSIKTFIPDKEKDYFDFLLQNFSQGKPIVHIETNAVNKNGEIFVIHTTYTMERNDKHELIGVAISAHDATCQAREKEAIKKIEEKLKNVVENIQEWVWEVDDQSRIVYSNHLVTNFLGFSIEEVLDKEISSLLLEQKDLEYFKSNKPWENQVIQMRGKNNQVCQLECSAVPFRLDNYSDKMGLRLAARDITERIRLEKMKEEFISMISHELRTPLSAIIAALDLLKSGGIPKENSQEVLDILIKNSHLLKELIDNILIVQRLQANQLRISKERISLNALVEDNIKCNQALADKKHISLCNELSENIYIEADFNQLSLVLNNFLSNAIKFSKENSKIRIYTNTENQRVRLSVSDEGRGISEDFKNKIFQRFVQEGALEHHIQTGSGLGLYISKEIIQRLGGEIGFVSEEAKGATFYFEFPVILK